MAKYNSLGELFTATANAIRAKTGSTDPIVAEDFPAAVEGIVAGGGGRFPETFSLMDVTPAGIGWPVILEFGRGYGYLAGTNGSLYTSQDGRVWDRKPLPSSSMQPICFKDGILFARSSNSQDSVLSYSMDFGTTWSPCEGLISLTTVNSPTKANGRWYLSANTANDNIKVVYHSLDGKTWDKIANEDCKFSKVIFANGIYMGVPSGNTKTCRSTDGINWSTIDAIDKLGCDVLHYRGRWFAYGFNVVYHSDDGGATWTKQADNIYRRVHDGTAFIGLCSDDSTIYRSDDGLNWTSCGLTVSSKYASIGVCDNIIGYVYDSKLTKLYYSLDRFSSWYSVDISAELGLNTASPVAFDGKTLLLNISKPGSNQTTAYVPVFA